MATGDVWPLALPSGACFVVEVERPRGAEGHPYIRHAGLVFRAEWVANGDGAPAVLRLHGDLHSAKVQPRRRRAQVRP